MKAGNCRNVLIVARNELAEGLRSRRVVAVLVLYLAGAMVAMHGFISALIKMEEQLTKMLGISPGAAPGAVVDALWRSAQFREMVKALVRDKDVAMGLFAVPPIAVVFGWLVFAFTPVLVMLTTSSRIAEEIGSGSARFVFLRTPRATWCLGKFVGQALLKPSRVYKRHKKPCRPRLKRLLLVTALRSMLVGQHVQ